MQKSHSLIQEALQCGTLESWEKAIFGMDNEFSCDKSRSVNGDKAEIIDLNFARLVSLAYSFYGEKLVECGRDIDGVIAFDRALDKAFSFGGRDQAIKNIGLSRARALQRLMRYRDAIIGFGDVLRCFTNIKTQNAESISKMFEAVKSVMTCHMRLGDTQSARDILEKSIVLFNNDGLQSFQAELKGLLGVLQLVNDPNRIEKDSVSLDLLLQSYGSASLSSRLFCRWVLFTICLQNSIELSVSMIPSEPMLACYNETIKALAEINVNAFDVPQNILIDNKVKLHFFIRSLHDSKTCRFWPEGYILPEESELFWAKYQHDNEIRWVLKDSAGYGSYGNKVVSSSDAILRINGEHSKLCQKLIDPSMLINRKRFSIRLYVTTFLTKDGLEVYVSREGLVKLATIDTPLHDDPFYTVSDMYTDDAIMTNSARQGDNSQQVDFSYLQATFLKHKWDYEKFWNAVKDLVLTVTYGFSNEISNCKSNKSLAKLMIPKIFGFDLIVDSNQNPWLIEVNRFPGLEPRNDQDFAIKQLVVEASWALAATRANICPEKLFGFSLRRGDEIFEKIF